MGWGGMGKSLLISLKAHLPCSHTHWALLTAPGSTVTIVSNGQSEHFLFRAVAFHVPTAHCWHSSDPPLRTSPYPAGHTHELEPLMRNLLKTPAHSQCSTLLAA